MTCGASSARAPRVREQSSSSYIRKRPNESINFRLERGSDYDQRACSFPLVSLNPSTNKSCLRHLVLFKCNTPADSLFLTSLSAVMLASVLPEQTSGGEMIKEKSLAILLAVALVFLSATSGAANHKSHRHGKAYKVLAVAAPIGIGAAFGPAGSVGYQGFKHRRWIKHRLTRHHRMERHHARHYRA